MKLALKAAVLFLAFSATCGVHAQNITQEEVRQYLSSMDEAIKAKNVTRIAQLLSDSASFSITVSADGKSQTQRLRKPKYLALLRNTWAMASDYRYRRTNERISLDGNRAKVSADVDETLMMSGQHIAMRTFETATLEKIDGKILLTNIIALSSM